MDCESRDGGARRSRIVVVERGSSACSVNVCKRDQRVGGGRWVCDCSGGSGLRGRDLVGSVVGGDARWRVGEVRAMGSGSLAGR